MGKRCLCFLKSSKRRVTKTSASSLTMRLRQLGGSSPPPATMTMLLIGGSSTERHNNVGSLTEANVGKGKKKAAGMRLWMKFDRLGNSELVEWDKTAIIKRVRIPARDLRVLGSITSHSSNILAREKAIVVNLDFVRAIVTPEEVLILDPLSQEVLPFVDQLRQQLPGKSQLKTEGVDNRDPKHRQIHNAPQGYPETVDELQHELAFEFQVLEVALEVVCAYFDSNVEDLERAAYPVLEELTRNVSTSSLENVRTLKSNLTRLLARVQKVRDEIEHLLDDDLDMAHLYLTRKQMQNQQSEALLDTAGSDSIISAAPHPPQHGYNQGASLVTGSAFDDYDIEDLEMLLEAYFIKLDGTRNKILTIREYIDDTEDYVNIQLDNKRNELIQLQLILTSAALPVSLDTLVCGAFSVNIPCTLYNVNGIFGYFVGVMIAASFLLFLLILGYARWKKLLG